MAPLPLSKTKLSQFRKFLQKKTREAEGRCLIEGWHLLDEAVKSGRALRALVFDPEARRGDAEEAILERATAGAEEVYEATVGQISQLSDTKSAQGVVALVDRPGVEWPELWPKLSCPVELRALALDDVGDPGNCGTIIRAAAWFGIDAVLLGRGCAELENGKTIRASMGAVFHLPVAVGVHLPTALGQLRESGVAVVSSELEGARSLSAYSFPRRAALVIGNEARGVSSAISALADERVFVPRYGTGESLNAAMAATAFLARWRGCA